MFNFLLSYANKSPINCLQISFVVIYYVDYCFIHTRSYHEFGISFLSGLSTGIIQLCSKYTLLIFVIQLFWNAQKKKVSCTE